MIFAQSAAVASNAKAEIIIAVVSGVIVFTVTSALAAARRYARRELVDPFTKMNETIQAERDKRRKFQKKIVKRIAANEKKADLERRLQVTERTRVLSETPRRPLYRWRR
jgi:NhaP-type Na+/H+ or K+/H+ antiporter